MQTFSLTRNADTTVWLALQCFQQGGAAPKMADSPAAGFESASSVARDADSTVCQALQTFLKTLVCREEPGSKWRTPLLLNFPGNLFGFTQESLRAPEPSRAGAWVKMADSPAVAALKPSIQVSRHRSDCAPSANFLEVTSPNSHSSKRGSSARTLDAD